MYTIVKGSIPKGKVVMHSCDVRLCINPEHLSVGTQKENIQDAIQKGRPHVSVLEANKTHCAQGHPYSEWARWDKCRGNLRRACRLCQRIAQRRKAGWPDALLSLPPQKLGQRPHLPHPKKMTAQQNRDEHGQ
jgi:hypothetical protein